MKVILNKCYGGFDVSDEAYELYAKKAEIRLYKYSDSSSGRRCLEKCGANDRWHYVSYYFKKDYGDVVDLEDVDWGEHVYLDSEHREDPILVEVVEELGSEASGRFGKLVVVEITDGLDYVVDDYDGIETLHENVRCW